MATGFQNLSKQKKFALKKCPQTKTETEMRQNNFEIYILFIIWRSYSRKKEYATNFKFFSYLCKVSHKDKWLVQWSQIEQCGWIAR
jgi:hypothetical protein